jgi:hypothetical protein
MVPSLGRKVVFALLHGLDPAWPTSLPERRGARVLPRGLSYRRPIRITLEEVSPWTGPAHGQVRRSVAVTPETTVLVVTRAEEGTAGRWPGGFSEIPLAPSDDLCHRCEREAEREADRPVTGGAEGDAGIRRSLGQPEGGGAY